MKGLFLILLVAGSGYQILDARYSDIPSLSYSRLWTALRNIASETPRSYDLTAFYLSGLRQYTPENAAKLFSTYGVEAYRHPSHQVPLPTLNDITMTLYARHRLYRTLRRRQQKLTNERRNLDPERHPDALASDVEKGSQLSTTTRSEVGSVSMPNNAVHAHSTPNAREEISNQVFAIINIVRSIAGVCLLVPTVRILCKGRKKDFADPIFEIWLAFLCTRLALSIFYLDVVGEFLPNLVKESFVCRHIMGYLVSLTQSYSSYYSLFLCIYQIYVIMFPLNYFYSRNDMIRFRCRVRRIIIAIFVYGQLTTLIKNGNLTYLRCRGDNRFVLSSNPIFPWVLVDTVFLSFFSCYLLQLVMYVFLGLLALFNRKPISELSERKRQTIKAQQRVSIIGALSFFSTFPSIVSFVLFNQLFRSLQWGPLFQFLVTLDRLGDPFYFYLGNSKFRKQANKIIFQRSEI